MYDFITNEILPSVSLYFTCIYYKCKHAICVFSDDNNNDSQ